MAAADTCIRSTHTHTATVGAALHNFISVISCWYNFSIAAARSHELRCGKTRPPANLSAKKFTNLNDYFIRQYYWHVTRAFDVNLTKWNRRRKTRSTTATHQAGRYVIPSLSFVSFRKIYLILLSVRCSVLFITPFRAAANFSLSMKRIQNWNFDMRLTVNGSLSWI